MPKDKFLMSPCGDVHCIFAPYELWPAIMNVSLFSKRHNRMKKATS